MSFATDTATYEAPAASRQSWFARSEAWLDERGKGAWIAAMVLGFIFFWPVGLALLAYMIWSKRMFSNSCSKRRNRSFRHQAMSTLRPSGNAAFDAYKEETLSRLQSEQDAFESFLERLREAKDKAEFDQFMEDRDRRRSEATAAPEQDGKPA